MPVRAIDFRGGHYKVTVFAEALGTTLHAEVSRALRDALRLATGSLIALSFPAESSVLFPAA